MSGAETSLIKNASLSMGSAGFNGTYTQPAAIIANIPMTVSIDRSIHCAMQHPDLTSYFASMISAILNTLFMVLLYVMVLLSNIAATLFGVPSAAFWTSLKMLSPSPSLSAERELGGTIVLIILVGDHCDCSLVAMNSSSCARQMF